MPWAVLGFKGSVDVTVVISTNHKVFFCMALKKGVLPSRQGGRRELPKLVSTVRRCKEAFWWCCNWVPDDAV